MSDDNKMGATEVAGGAITGAGVAYGVSAYHGKTTLTNVSKADIIKIPKEEITKAVTTFKQNMAKLVQENNLDQKTLETAQRRGMLKIGEKLGIDMNELILKKLGPLNKLRPEDVNPEVMGETMRELGESFTTVFQAIHKKAPTLDAYFKFIKEAQTTLVDTIAETLGKSGAERTKFVEQYTGAIGDYTRSMYSAAKKTVKKLASTAEYSHAKWYEKPLVAFESMSLKGKVGLGAVALISSLGAAFAINHSRSDKDPETPAK